MVMNYQPLKHGEFETPIDFFNKLDSEFHFTLDPCATRDNTKCSRFFTKEDDGLNKDWSNEIVFCNPPYNNVSEWVEKSYNEAKYHNAIVVMLIPSRTDTKWFHKYCLENEIRFVKGRLKFGKDSAPFPSMLVIFKNKVTENAR